MFQINRFLKLAFTLAFTWLFAIGVACGDEPLVPPAGGQDVLNFRQDGAVEFRKSSVEATADWAQIKDMPFQTVFRVTSDVRFSDPANMRVTVSIDGTFQNGDVLLLSFWMRRPNAGGQPNNATLFVQTGPDENGQVKTEFEYKLSAYREWKQHVRSFVATADCDSQDGKVSFHLGEAGTIAEIADLRLINYGASYDIKSLPRSTVQYRGREPDAKWRKEALARIEDIRKADMIIEVVDAAGQPVENAAVTVQMQRHAFGFGNVVNAELLGGEEKSFPYTKVRSGSRKTSSWQDAQKYREIIKTHFNCVTFESELRPHVWKKLMGDSRGSARARKVFTEHAVPWLQENNINIRGHYLAWAPMDFNAVEKEFVGDPEAHRKWLWEHLADVLPKTADYVSEWDSINYIVGWGKHTYEKEYGGPEIYAEILAEARRLAPGVTHAINEGKVLPDGYKREPYKRVIRILNEQGQAPDTVGFMAHFGLTSLTPPEELLEVYDDFAEVAPRLQLSEFDVEAGDDEQLQADYYRDVMIATFSHPNFVSIVQWGFWENAHWKPAAALWRKDWSLKPAGEVFVDLVKKQWWTQESATTSAAGSVQVRGFLGDYQVSVTHEGKTVTANAVLNREGTAVRLQVE